MDQLVFEIISNVMPDVYENVLLDSYKANYCNAMVMKSHSEIKKLN